MTPSKAQAVIIAERRSKAVQLRLAGVDYERIAQQLEYKSRQQAREDVHRAYVQATAEVRESVEELRNQDLERLARLQAAFWGAALQGDPKAGEMILKILARRAKLMGMDSALKVEITTIDQIDAEIQQLREKLALPPAPEMKAIEA
jgi:hypothetical protein